jgi:hypothetical protein
MDLNTESISTVNYVESTDWYLTNVKADIIESNNQDGFGLFNQDFKTEIANIQITVKRKSNTFMFYGIYPCLFLNIMTLMCYEIPEAHRFGFSEFIFLK